MKLVLFQTSAEGQPVPGILTDGGVVDISTAVPLRTSRQLTMQGIIDNCEQRRSTRRELESWGEPRPLSSVRLRPPLPRPGKILCCIGNYWEHAQREARALNMFLKNPEAVVGPGDTITLPKLTEPWIFMHEAELALVIKGPAKEGKREDWRRPVLRSTCPFAVSDAAASRSLTARR